MACKTGKEKRKPTGDCIDVEEGRQWFAGSETDWLVGQAVQHLNGADPTDERTYQHVIALLRGQRASNDVLQQLAHDTAADPTLRWNILHVLGDAGDVAATEFLVKAALERLPERLKEGCEGPFDNELLNRTMAVHAIAAIARRDAAAADGLIAIIDARPERALLIEVVKCAVELGLHERVQAILAKEDQWILDIKRVDYREVQADPERDDGKEIGFVPPRRGAEHTTPQACACVGKEQ